MDSLDPELDRLFQLPLTELVGERNALAARLRKAGDRAAAERIKALKRPAPAAWALNQVRFREPASLEQAQQAATQLRDLHAQDGADPRQLSAALAAQRRAAQAVIEAALRCCRKAGLPDGQLQQRRIFATLQGWLSGAGDEPPGRMTHELETSGFEAISVVGAAQAQVPLLFQASAQPPPAPSPSPAEPPQDSQALERARARLGDSERSARDAREVLRVQRDEQDRATRELARAQAELRAAEDSLRGLRARVVEHQDAAARVHALVAEAQQAQAHAEAALLAARAELLALQVRT